MNQRTKAVVGYSGQSIAYIVESVEVVAEVHTGGHDGNEFNGTELLSVVRTQWGDLALTRRSVCNLENSFGTPVTYVEGSKKDVKKLASILRELAHALEEK